MDSQVTVAIIGAVATLITAIVTGVQAYRAGVAKNKSVEADTSEKLHKLVNLQLDALEKKSKELQSRVDILEVDHRKWRIAFSIVKSEMRNKHTKSRLSFETVEQSTITQLQDIRDEISNHN